MSVDVIQGIRVTKTSNLRFGPMIPGTTDGTVALDVTGSRTQTGNLILLTSSSVPFSAANFTMLGTPSITYSITLPSSVTLTRQGGAETIVVNSFVSSPSGNGSLDTAGTGTLAVGGTLTVPASQTPGYYSGQFTVTLTYQ